MKTRTSCRKEDVMDKNNGLVGCLAIVGGFVVVYALSLCFGVWRWASAHLALRLSWPLCLPASDVRSVAVGSRRTPPIRLTLTHQKLPLAVCKEDVQGFT